MNKTQLEERVSELEAVNRQLASELKEAQADRDYAVRRFEQEKHEHRTTHTDLYKALSEKDRLEEALGKARLTIAELMTQCVRLQGRLEGALIVTGHMQLKQGK